MFSTTKGLRLAAATCSTDSLGLSIRNYLDSPYDGRDKGGHPACRWLPLMASSSNGQIGALCAENFRERILSEANNVSQGEYASRYRRDQH